MSGVSTEAADTEIAGATILASSAANSSSQSDPIAVTQQQHKQIGIRSNSSASYQQQQQLQDQFASNISSSSSSALTNSPSSSLTSITTNSPTSSNPISSDPSSGCCGSLVVAATAATSAAAATDKMNEIQDKYSATNYLGAQFEQQSLGEASPKECQQRQQQELDYGVASEDLVPTSALEPSSLIGSPQGQFCDRDDFFSNDGLVASANVAPKDQQQQQGMVGAEITASSAGRPESEATISMIEPRHACIAGNGEHTDTYITGFDEQPVFSRLHESAIGPSGPTEIARLERSNSCSQADAICSIEHLSKEAAAAASAAKCMLGPTSISHENLASTAATSIVAFDNISLNPPTLDEDVNRGTTRQQIVVGAELAKTDNSIQSAGEESQPLGKTGNDCDALSKQEPSLGIQQQFVNNPANNSTSGASRFFSSKLNTGSLWSLLSVGSNHSTTSTSNANETMTSAIDNQALNLSADCSGAKHDTDLAKQSTNQDHEVSKSSLGAGFFNRVQQFKRQHSGQATSSHRPPTTSSSSIDEASLYSKPDLVSNEAASLRLSLKRFRFQVKYIGSAILHKNFTLPMLEWIARDIKRQTIKGAQSISQRQFTIPVRDIILEIQSYQLMGTSCKDGHCIFVHPMHCVSKYAQLQHDPNCFSYLIRDTKESPYFCHVFQAKSTHKVHEIFSAIREATTSQTSIVTNPKAAQQLTTEKGLLSIGNSDINDKQSSSRIQKSASSDGQTRNIFGNMTSRDARLGGMGSPPTMFGTPQSSSNPVFTSHASIQRQDNQADNAQFENSYQFEVMFVKKVKLQCRRVPASFVDDALETLRSFDVMKGSDSKAQMKGIGKRIISASVDERQEYDEVCQSPTQSVNANKHTDKPVQPKADLSVADTADADQRRGSSASLNRNHSTIKEERESRSCQQSPAKVSTGQCETDSTSNSEIIDGGLKKHYQSTGCLDNLGSTIKWAKAGEAPHYFNDFSPYNTITSNDLNERIAAIPVVSSSVSLDHETRQRLARQVRETIMATAANIKKDVYASGDKKDTGSSFKVFDSLSCTAVSSVPSIDDNDLQVATNQPINEVHTNSSQIPEKTSSQSNTEATAVNRRSSAAAGPFFQPNAQTTNNFDLFRRTSARQVVKNRTMLLLIGKEELCTISIDKHQVLFSKSFSSIVHCLQGNNNRDHFGLICRDSGKINPNTESYVGLIFKCQSEKVVREIMGALKQVIYNSQHSYHGYNSIYNPFNAAQNTTKGQNSISLERSQTTASPASFAQTGSSSTNQNSSLYSDQSASTTKSLAAKRGFLHHLELDRSKFPIASHHQSLDTATPSTSSVLSKSGQSTSTVKAPAPKNLIKSMFCDNCPLYWYHRLCCDIESLPAEASKTIILRRIDSSLAEREQDELYSKFSEFNIESIDEHNEIFMSLLRHICERNQLRHNQTSAHQAAIARNNPGLVKQSTLPSIVSRQSSLQTPASGGITSTIISNPSQLTNTLSRSSAVANSAGVVGGHQRSGSSGGSLGFVLGQSSNQSISNASTLAMDNLKRAKNNLSVSIENMLKRRSSIKDDMEEQQQTIGNIESGSSHLPARSGSFRSATRESRVASASNNEQLNSGSGLKRSSSTSDYSSANQLNQSMNSIATWKDSFSRTINDDLTNPFMGLFRRRSSTFGTKGADGDEDIPSRKNATSTDSLNRIETQHYVTPQHQPASPSSSESRFHLGSTHSNGGSSPSSMLSSAFWKKSIFDKIRQPQADDIPVDTGSLDVRDSMALATSPKAECKRPARTREELRSLWRKAIFEQITLIKMDKQNQRLQAASSTEHDIQRVKLNYKDVPYKRDALASWDRLLKQDPTKKVEFVEVAKLVRYGVPKQRRGEIWMFLMNQYQLRHGTSFQPVDSEYHGDANQTYRSLLSQLSTQQHEIFVDIGRTFPTHPYYSQYLSIGQLSLFNLLKAYSLLDQEVGYCQGLSFVAGILLLHVESEDEAFELMRHLLFNFGLRKQYLPSMNALHLQFYQITRLLRDYEYEVFNHFDRYDISPSLYAAPWFLTLFASQFPLGFVARLLDLVYLMGIEAIFRVSLNLLAYHRAAILDRKSLESTMDFMRNDLVKIDDKNLVTIFDKSMSIDLRNKLIEYEIEYTFYCAEDKTKLSSKYKTQNEPMKIRSELETTDELKQYKTNNAIDPQSESTSIVADATATVIIQHLLANNHLKTLQSNYSY